MLQSNKKTTEMGGVEEFQPVYKKLCEMVLFLNQQRNLGLSICSLQEVVFKRGKAHITLRGVSKVNSYRDTIRYFMDEFPSFDLQMTTSTSYEPQHTIVMDVPAPNKKWWFSCMSWSGGSWTRWMWMVSLCFLFVSILLYQLSAHYLYNPETNRHPAEQFGHGLVEFLMNLQEYWPFRDNTLYGNGGAGVKMNSGTGATVKNLNDLYNQ
jgi:hypothetical protein